MKIKRQINEVLPLATKLVEALKPYCEKIEICGSIKRHKETVGDIEILCMPKKVIVQYSLFDIEIEKTDPRLMKFIKNYKIIRGDLDNGRMISFEYYDVQVDLFTANQNNYGYIKVLRTGPALFNQRIVLPMLKKYGYEMIHGNIQKKGEIISVPDEEDVFKLFNCEVHPPQLRDRC